MRRKLNRSVCCILSILLMMTCLPVSVYSAENTTSYPGYDLEEDMLVEDAAEVPEDVQLEEEARYMEEFTEEEDAYLIPDAEYPEEDDSVEEDETAEDVIPNEENVGVQYVDEFIGAYDVKIIWPDGAVMNRLLNYEGTDAEDIERSLCETVAADLGQVDIRESEYSITYSRDSRMSSTVRKSVLNSNGDLVQYLTTHTEYYHVTVTTIQPEFTEMEGDAQILAHRGTETAPENTLAAFRMCAIKGFHYVGADLQFTADGVPVILHDVTLNRTVRTSDGRQFTTYVDVEKTKFKTIREYDAGIAAGSFWKGEKVPTFEEFIQLCKKLDFVPNIHIKSSIYMSYARLATLADIVKDNGMQGRVVWAADDIDYLRFIRTVDPVSGLDLVIYRWVPSVVTMVKGLKTDENFVEIGAVKSVFTNEIAATLAYNEIYITTSADTEEEVRNLDASVRLISTDTLSPDVARECARERKSSIPEIYDTPVEGTDYRLLAGTSAAHMFSIRNSTLGSTMVIHTLRNYPEMNDFRFKKLKDGYYQVLNTRNMLALEVRDGKSANDTPIILNTWDASDKQRWRIVKNENGSVSLVNKVTGKAIQTQGGKIAVSTALVQNTFTGAECQQFWMVKEPNQVTVSYTGTYYLTCDGVAGSTAGVKNNAVTAKASICLAKKAQDDALKFKLYYSGDGYYRIMNVKSKMFLTVKDGSVKDGTDVIQDVWKNSAEQRWLLKKNKDGSYILTSKIGTCLQLDSLNANPVNVSAGTRKGIVTQHWRLGAA